MMKMMTMPGILAGACVSGGRAAPLLLEIRRSRAQEEETRDEDTAEDAARLLRDREGSWDPPDHLIRACVSFPLPVALFLQL